MKKYKIAKRWGGGFGFGIWRSVYFPDVYCLKIWAVAVGPLTLYIWAAQ